jgi:diguanylate cyclase (GGDEF)-like protein/PAS domain S-box-containing protein
MREEGLVSERIRRVARLRFDPEMERRFRDTLRDWLGPTRAAVFLILAAGFGLAPLYHGPLLQPSDAAEPLLRTLELAVVVPALVLAAVLTLSRAPLVLRQAAQSAAVLAALAATLAFRLLALRGEMVYPAQMTGIVLLAVAFFGGFTWWRIGPLTVAVALAATQLEFALAPEEAAPQAYSLVLMGLIALLGAYHLEFLMRLTWWDYTRLRQAQAAQRRSEQRFKAFMDHSPLTAWIKDADGRYVYRNKTHSDRYGEPGEDWIGRRDAEVFPAEDAQRFARTDAEVLVEGRAVHFDTRNRDRSGQLVEWWIQKFPIREESGEVLVGGLGVDVGERNRLERELRASESRFQAFLDNNPGLSWMKDEEGRYLYTSASYLRMLGLEDVRGKTDFDFLPERFAARMREIQRKVLETGEVQVAEGPAYDLKVSDRYWTLTMFPFTDIEGRRFVGGVAIDITDRKRAEDLVRQQALSDELTGLHNRRGFLLLAAQELRRARRAGRECSLLFVDLDDLKHLNDRHGHAAGDRALTLVAEALRSQSRNSDIVARIGGDEFVIFAVDAQESMTLRERVQARIEAACAGAGLPFSVTASMGSIRIDAAMASIEEAVASADAQMYETKRRRKTGPAQGAA